MGGGGSETSTAGVLKAVLCCLDLFEEQAASIRVLRICFRKVNGNSSNWNNLHLFGIKGSTPA